MRSDRGRISVGIGRNRRRQRRSYWRCSSAGFRLQFGRGPTPVGPLPGNGDAERRGGLAQTEVARLRTGCTFRIAQDIILANMIQNNSYLYVLFCVINQQNALCSQNAGVLAYSKSRLPFHYCYFMFHSE